VRKFWWLVVGVEAAVVAVVVVELFIQRIICCWRTKHTMLRLLLGEHQTQIVIGQMVMAQMAEPQFLILLSLMAVEVAVE
jgi:hypothetical protein